MGISGLVFDFDGLVFQTEETSLAGWRHCFELHGQELDVSLWLRNLGSHRVFDLHAHLQELCGYAIDEEELTATRMAHRDELHSTMDVLPGVKEHLRQADELGLPVAIASSSPPGWVTGHLERLGIHDHFAHVSCFDGTCSPKPAPDLYLSAIGALGVEPGEAIAYEDSHNGVVAAKAAGLWCVAVPHDLSRHMDFSAADLVVDSLVDVTVAELLQRFG